MHKSALQIAGAIALGVAVAMSAQAGEMTMKKEPASPNESMPGEAADKAKGGVAKGAKGRDQAGVSTMPGKGPASVSESAPQRTGKEPVTPMTGDSKATANPKSPSSVSESAPQKTGDADKKAKGSAKEMTK